MVSPDRGMVLIVEDDPDLRESLAGLLELEGFRTRQAADGLEGLHACKVCHPDVVVSDIRMPRKNGLDFLRDLRREVDHPPPVVLMTAYADVKPDDAARAGAAELLAKPLDIPRFVELLSRLGTGDLPQ
ncbi:MAG: response regulator [Myxococcota bacterium]